MTPCRGGSAHRSENVANCYFDTSGRERGMLIAFIVLLASLAAADPDGDGEAHSAAVAPRQAFADISLSTIQRVPFHEA